MIIACPHCAGLNRIPAEKLAAAPVCGKCKQPLFNGQPVDITSANFANLVQKSELPIVLDFWASWCAPCRQENPNIVAAYNNYKDKGFDILDSECHKLLQQALVTLFQHR